MGPRCCPCKSGLGSGEGEADGGGRDVTSGVIPKPGSFLMKGCPHRSRLLLQVRRGRWPTGAHQTTWLTRGLGMMIFEWLLRTMGGGGTWVAQSVRCPTLDFSSGCDLTGVRLSPALGSTLS